MKRHLLIIAIFLFAAAVLNVAVAWGCALTVTVRLTEQEWIGAARTLEMEKAKSRRR